MKSCAYRSGFKVKSCAYRSGFTVKSCAYRSGFAVKSCAYGSGFTVKSCVYSSGFRVKKYACIDVNFDAEPGGEGAAAHRPAAGGWAGHCRYNRSILVTQILLLIIVFGSRLIILVCGSGCGVNRSTIAGVGIDAGVG